MRDLRLIMPSEPNQGWTMDFDIINGSPAFLAYDRNTQDQRAAVAAYTVRGTIPGMPEEGISWSELYENSDETLIVIDNEIKQPIQAKAAVADQIAGMYIPAYDFTEDGVQLTIFQG